MKLEEIKQKVCEVYPDVYVWRKRIISIDCIFLYEDCTGEKLIALVKETELEAWQSALDKIENNLNKSK